jgi:integrase
MKGGRQHRVPLSDAAMNVLKRIEVKRGELLFPGAKRGRPLSDVTLEKVTKRIRADITPHGFRSTFRDWAAECTNFAREVAEMALAHKISDDVEAAYRRGDLFDKRRRLMRAWGEYCESKPRASSGQRSNIVTIGAR